MPGCLCRQIRQPLNTPPAPNRATLSQARALAGTYKKFALFSSPYALVGMLRDRLSFLIVGGMFSSADTGYYSWAYRLANAPVGLVAGGIRPVIFQEASAGGVASSPAW